MCIAGHPGYPVIMYHHLIVTIILSCGTWCFSPYVSFFLFLTRFTKPVCMGHQNTPQLAAQSNPCLEKKRNNKRNNNGYITECIGTKFGRTQPGGCTSLNTPIPRRVCHRPHPTKALLFRGTSPRLRPLAAPALRDSWAVPVSLGDDQNLRSRFEQVRFSRSLLSPCASRMNQLRSGHPPR